MSKITITLETVIAFHYCTVGRLQFPDLEGPKGHTAHGHNALEKKLRPQETGSCRLHFPVVDNIAPLARVLQSHKTITFF